jgi:copper chaperone CopZ
MEKEYRIVGMHCASCAMSIDGELEELPGVQEATTSFARGRTRVTYDPAAVTEEKIVAAIREAGYVATPV